MSAGIPPICTARPKVRRPRLLVRWGFVLLWLLSLLAAIPTAWAADAPAVAARAAILLDVATGTVLYAKEADVRLEPASTTKILTALVVLEDFPGSLQDMVTVSPRAASVEGTRAGLAPGQQVRLQELLYALMLGSANDAAVAIAEHLAGSVPAFAERMNQKAAQIGARDSHFVNPSGLPDPQHYTTARDLARIARHALSLPAFSRLVATKSMKLSWLPDPIYNHNRLLFAYQGADGVKNGYTTSAGYTLVGSATRGDTRLLGVVLGGQRTSFIRDMSRLLDYGFQHFQTVRVARQGGQVAVLPAAGARAPVALLATRDLAVLVPRDGSQPWPQARLVLTRPLRAPLEAGQVVGTLEAARPDGTVLASVPVAVAEDRPLPLAAAIWQTGRGLAVRVLQVGLVVGLIRLLWRERERRRRRLARLQRREERW